MIEKMSAGPDAFADMLKNKDLASNFDLHKVETDSKGTQKAFKVDKDQIATKTKMNNMALKVIEQI